MKKGFTLLELTAAVGIVAASVSLGGIYQKNMASDQHAKNLAREIYEYNGAVGRHIRYADKDLLESQVGVHEGTSWISNLPATLLPGGQTKNFGIIPTTTITKEDGGLFTTKTVWSPVMRGSEAYETLMGKIALYASSKVINDTNFNRSAQGATVYCPAGDVELLKDDVKEICRANPGLMVSMNFGIPAPTLEVQLEALSIDHKNIMKAPIVFGDSNYIPGGVNKIPYEELDVSEMTCSGGLCEVYLENEYHSYDTFSDYYYINGSQGDYERTGDDIRFVKSNGDTTMYNRSTRDLTFESSSLCEGAPDPEPTSIPFTEESIAKFTDVYGDGSEYEYIDAEGGAHYYYPDWNEYSYYHGDGRYYYRSDWGTNYEDGVGGSYYVDEFGEFSYTYTPADPSSCQVSYSDVDLLTGAGSNSEWNRIENVGRIYSRDDVLKFGNSPGSGLVPATSTYWLSSFSNAKAYSEGRTGTKSLAGGFIPWREDVDLGLGATTIVDFGTTYKVDEYGDLITPKKLEQSIYFDDKLAVSGDMEASWGIATRDTVKNNEASTSILIAETDHLDLRGVKNSSGDYVKTDEDGNIIKDEFGYDVIVDAPSVYMNTAVLLSGVSARMMTERANKILLEEGDVDVDYHVNIQGNASASHVDATFDPSILEEKEQNDPEMEGWLDGSVMYNDGVGGNSIDPSPSRKYDLKGRGTLNTQSLTAQELAATGLDFKLIEFDGAPGSAIPGDYCSAFEVGKYKNGDIAVCDENKTWRKLSSGASLWESDTIGMFQYGADNVEEKVILKTFEDLKSYCSANFGADYYPSFEGRAIGSFSQGLSLKRIDTGPYTYYYEYYINPQFTSLPRTCIKVKTH